MDKETLSNYGWIVICVLVMAVMLAFATPFGQFISDAVWNAAKGLFDVNNNAMGILTSGEITDEELQEEKNEFGFVFNQPYIATMEGYPIAYIFYEDGSVSGWIGDAMGAYLPAGGCTYSTGKIDLQGSEIEVLDNGRTLSGDGMTMYLHYVGDGEIKKGATYLADPNNLMGLGATITLVIEEDNTATISADGSPMYTFELTYGENIVTMSNDEVGEFVSPIYPDGKKIIAMEQIVFVLQCSHENVEYKEFKETCTTPGCSGGDVCIDCGEIVTPEAIIPAPGHKYNGDHICIVCGQANEYAISAAGYLELTGIDISSGDIVIPDTFQDKEGNWYKVTSIADRGFSDCKNITSVDMSQTEITTIGSSAFHHCEKLASVTFPETLTTIKSSAFYYYTRLTEVVIPKNVTTIERMAFSTSWTLKTVIFEEGSKLTTIGDDAFGSNIIESITIPASVTNIEGQIIQRGGKALNIYVESGNKNYCSVDGVLFTKDMKEIVEFPDGRRGDYVVPNGVTTIQDTAFAYSDYITSITLPNSITTIGANAFWSCRALTNINIPNSVKTIGYGAFGWCNISEIYIPASVTKIGDNQSNPFECCTKLTTITVDSNNPNYCSVDNVLYTMDMKKLICYAPGSTATTFTVPEGVEVIVRYAFYHNGAVKLEEIILPSTLKSIEFCAFECCSSLTTINIPANVTHIGNAAFRSCGKLATVTFENKTGWSARHNEDNTIKTFTEDELSDQATIRSYLTIYHVWTRE